MLLSCLPLHCLLPAHHSLMHRTNHRHARPDTHPGARPWKRPAKGAFRQPSAGLFYCSIARQKPREFRFRRCQFGHDPPAFALRPAVRKLGAQLFDMLFNAHNCLLIVARPEACPAPRVPGQGPQSGRASGDGGHDFSGAERGQDDANISRPPPKNGGAPSSLRRCARRRIMGGPQQTSSPRTRQFDGPVKADKTVCERPGHGKRPRNPGGCGAG